MKKMLILFLSFYMTLSFADKKSHIQFEKEIQRLNSDLHELFVAPEIYSIEDSQKRTKEEIDKRKIEIEVFYSNLFSYYADLKVSYDKLEKKALSSQRLSEEEKKIVSNSIKYDRDIMLSSILEDYQENYSNIKSKLKVATRTQDLYKLFHGKKTTFETKNNCQISKINFNEKSEILEIIIKKEQEEIEYKIKNKDIALHSVAVSNLSFQSHFLDKTVKMQNKNDLDDFLAINKRLVHKFYTQDNHGGLSKIVLYENKEGVIDNAYFEVDLLKKKSYSFLGFEYDSESKLEKKIIDCMSLTPGPKPASVK